MLRVLPSSEGAVGCKPIVRILASRVAFTHCGPVRRPRSMSSVVGLGGDNREPSYERITDETHHTDES